MIDFELDIFNAVCSALETDYPTLNITSQEYMDAPASFPAVKVRETSNTVDMRGVSSSGVEEIARIRYSVDVYSNKRVGAKAEAKAILAKIDAAMYSINMTRTYTESGQTGPDGSIYRIVTRYDGYVGRDGAMYRR